MRQVIELFRRAGTRLGITRRKRGRHTGAYLAEASQQRQATNATHASGRHTAPAATREFRQAKPQAAANRFRARAALGELRRDAPPISPARARQARTTRGAELRVMTHGIRLDQVFAAAMPVMPSHNAPDVALLHRVLVGLRTSL